MVTPCRRVHSDEWNVSKVDPCVDQASNVVFNTEKKVDHENCDVILKKSQFVNLLEKLKLIIRYYNHLNLLNP